MLVREPKSGQSQSPDTLPLIDSHARHILVECGNNNKSMASGFIFTDWHQKSSRFATISIPSDGGQRLNHARMIG